MFTRDEARHYIADRALLVYAREMKQDQINTLADRFSWPPDRVAALIDELGGNPRKKLAAALAARGMTHADLAARVEVHQTTISRACKANACNPELAKAIALALHISRTELGL